MTIKEMDALLFRLRSVMPHTYERMMNAGVMGAEFAIYCGFMPNTKQTVAATMAGMELQYIFEVHAATQAAKRAGENA